MSNVTVYRVENRTSGLGPYHSYCVTQWTDRNHDTTSHPTASEDGMAGVDYNLHRFGFASLAQLLAWFTREELCRLGDMGFCIAVYSVAAEDVIMGGRQLAFVRNEYFGCIERLDLRGSACTALSKKWSLSRPATVAPTSGLSTSINLQLARQVQLAVTT